MCILSQVKLIKAEKLNNEYKIKSIKEIIGENEDLDDGYGIDQEILQELFGDNVNLPGMLSVILPEVNEETVGEFNLSIIDPDLNPAEENWLSKEISNKVFGDPSRFSELTQEDFDNIKAISCMVEELNSGELVIPRQIGNLINLEDLSVLTNNKYLSLPEEIGNLPNLRYLRLGGFISDEEGLKNIDKLKNLKILCLVNNNISKLPEEIGNLTSLIKLTIDDKKLNSLPVEMINLQNLRSLTIESKVRNVPYWVSNLPSLTEFVWSFKIMD